MYAFSYTFLSIGLSVMRTAFKFRVLSTSQNFLRAFTLIALLPVVAYNLDDFVTNHGWRFGTVLVDLGLVVGVFLIFCWFSWRQSRQYANEVMLREQTEAELRAKERRLSEVLDSAHDRFWETDEQHRIVWRSMPASRAKGEGKHLNCTRWEALGIDLATDPHWAAHRDEMESHRPFRDFRYSQVKGGRVVHRSVSGRPFFDDDGNFKGYRGTTANVTDEVEARTNAAKIQEQFLSAMENIADGYALWSAEDVLITCNERFARLYGGHSRDDLGMTYEAFARSIASIISGDGPKLLTLLDWHRGPNAPLDIRHDGGWIEMREHHLADGHVLSLSRDITEQKDMEHQLQQAQKMKAVGQLTGGIAHDFNNLLQVVLGNIEMIIEQVPSGSTVAAQASIAKAASERGADLIRRLMAFSRQQPLQPRIFDINHMVVEMSEIARRTIGEDITIHTHLATGLRAVYLDRVQAEAAFLNLAINARDAMPNGGSLFVETSDVIHTGDEASHQLELPPGRYVLLSVTDTGTGMSPDVLAHAVEPFFTTKEVGKGTGLGLSMTYGFVKQSGGDVKIYSEQGIGTAVKLYLPIARANALDPLLNVTPEALPNGGETILLVEDEPRVRDYAVGQLERLGYQVIAASDGASALERINDLEGHIDLLFTDIVMPGGMNGRELAQQVAELYPALKVLYTSGYNQNAVIKAGRLEDGISLLVKPYHKADLARKIRQLLDSKAPAAEY